MRLFNIVSIQKFIQAFLGFFTVLIISYQLDDLQQAAYFSLNSIYSAHSILDLGLSVLIIQVCAYWFFQEKDKTRVSNFFMSFLYKTQRWYMGLSLLCFLIFPLGYLYFISISDFAILSWQLPLLLCIVSMTLYIASIPYVSLLEGMNKINEVYRIKILYYSIGTIFSWLIICGPNPLYAVSMVPLTTAIVIYFFIINKNRDLFCNDRRAGSADTFPWKKNIWPMQKKVFLTYISNYIILFTPALIYSHFNEITLSAKTGVTLVVLNMINVLASSNLIAKTPEMTKQFALKNKKEGLAMFFEELKKTLFYTFFGFVILFLIKYCAPESFFINRILPLSLLFFASLSFFVLQYAASMNVLFRANRDEFFYIELIALNLLFLGLLKIGGFYYFEKNIFLLYFLILMGFLITTIPRTFRFYKSLL